MMTLDLILTKYKYSFGDTWKRSKTIIDHCSHAYQVKIHASDNSDCLLEVDVDDRNSDQIIRFCTNIVIFPGMKTACCSAILAAHPIACQTSIRLDDLDRSLQEILKMCKMPRMELLAHVIDAKAKKLDRFHGNNRKLLHYKSISSAAIAENPFNYIGENVGDDSFFSLLVSLYAKELLNE